MPDLQNSDQSDDRGLIFIKNKLIKTEGSSFTDQTMEEIVAGIKATISN